jgi:ssDNA-binding Zn-finger/Zn-ribbon topoisomerase 1
MKQSDFIRKKKEEKDGLPYDLTSKHIVDDVWHWLVEDSITTYPDKRTWEFLAGILKQNYEIVISAQDLKKEIQKYFLGLTGIAAYKRCPACKEGLTVPRKSRYGYFVGCGRYPDCSFIATNKKRYNETVCCGHGVTEETKQ